ncbi:hypothetical protein LNP74_10780 [Klebsiella pneumoniae subsp. pneumoniae]|nr:hypothetical protein [Klebsiella pneumoniae subsp. pneumoniae]
MRAQAAQSMPSTCQLVAASLSAFGGRGGLCGAGVICTAALRQGRLLAAWWKDENCGTFYPARLESTLAPSGK